MQFDGLKRRDLIALPDAHASLLKLPPPQIIFASS